MDELAKQISANAWLRKCVATRDAQIDELVAERDAALEREQALAAQMMNLADALEAAEAPDAEAGDMWDASQCADWIRDQSPWAALAIRDLIKQAEALEHRADCIMAEAGYLENFRREVAGLLRNDAKDKRQRAQALK